VYGAAFERESRRQTVEPGACDETSHSNERPWNGASSAPKPASRQFHHGQDGINDRSFVVKVRTQLLVRGYPEAAPFTLDGLPRSADLHYRMDDYNEPILAFFDSRLR